MNRQFFVAAQLVEQMESDGVFYFLVVPLFRDVDEIVFVLHVLVRAEQSGVENFEEVLTIIAFALLQHLRWRLLAELLDCSRELQWTEAVFDLCVILLHLF